WSPTWTSPWPSGRCAAWRPSSSTGSGCCATPPRATCPTTCATPRATDQRPQGAINDNNKANTNLRIALRVQEGSDSRDVIDVTDAASIPRNAPGRAYVRLGPNEVVAIQSALYT